MFNVFLTRNLTSGESLEDLLEAVNDLREVKVADKGQREGVQEAGPLTDLGLPVVVLGLNGLYGHGEAVQVEEDPHDRYEGHLGAVEPHFCRKLILDFTDDRIVEF